METTRLEEATVVEYKRQLVAFARWMEMPLAVSSTPESITSYRHLHSLHIAS